MTVASGADQPTLRDQLDVLDELAFVLHRHCGPEVCVCVDDARELLPVVERAKAEAAAEALPASVDQLTREHFGCWVEIPTRQVAGYLYAVHDDFNDGYPGRTLVLVGEDGAAAVEEEFTDSSPAGYPRTLHTACVVTPDRPIVGPDQLELPRGDRT